MATELAHAYVTIIPSLKGASKTIQNELGGVNLSSTGKKWGNSLSTGIAGGLIAAGKIGVGAIASIGAAVSGMTVAGGISRAMKLDQAEMKFEAMGISVESAMKSCNEAVTGTAYGLDAAATVAASLGASGIQAGEDMTKSLKAVAGMAAMSGVSMEHMGVIFGKVAAQGRVQGDELTQLAENGVNATAALANYLGVTQAEVRKLVSKGVVDFDTFSKAMYATFGDAAQGANETFGGAMANVGAAFSRIGAKFASPALEGLRKVFVALIPAINTVSTALDPLVGRFTAFVEATSSRAVSGIEAFTEALTNTGSYISAFKDGLDAAFDGTIFGEFMGSLPQYVQGAVGAIVGFGQKALDAFSGVSAGGAAVAAVFSGFLVKFGAPLTAIVTKIGAFGATVAGAFSKLGGLAGIFATIGMKLNTFGSAIALCGGGVKGLAAVAGGLLRGALMSILSPVTLIVGGIAALAAAFAYLMTTNEGFRAQILGLVATIGASLAPVIAIVAQVIGNMATMLLPVVTNLISAIVPVLGKVITIALQIVAAVAPIVTLLVAALVPAIETVITVATSIVDSALPVIVGAIDAALTVIQGVISAVMAIVRGDWEGAWNIIKDALVSAWGSIVSGVEGGIGKLMDWVGKIPGKIKGFFSDAASWLTDAGAAIIGGLAEGIKGAVGKVTGAISGVLTSAREFLPFSPAKRGPFSGKGWTLYSGRSIVGALADGINGSAGSVVRAMSSVASDAAGALGIDGLKASADYAITRSKPESFGYMAAAEIGAGAGTVNNYYIDGINVNGTTEEQFASEFMALMRRYGRLART